VFTPANPTPASTNSEASVHTTTSAHPGLFRRVPRAFELESHPDVLARFRAGERDALAYVYERYCDDVLRSMRRGFTLKGGHSLRIAGLYDEAARQDAVQEAFLKAFSETARLGYDGVRPYRVYLTQIARNVQIDHARQRRREVPTADMDGHDGVGASVTRTLARHSPVDDDSVEPELALDWARRRRATLGYLAELPPELRQFVHLRYAEDLSQVEVARAMAITRRRARTLEQRLLGGLRRWLRRESEARRASIRSHASRPLRPDGSLCCEGDRRSVALWGALSPDRP
jgi:RNA polymerase sigma factor (sigma-70 family)